MAQPAPRTATAATAATPGPRQRITRRVAGLVAVLFAITSVASLAQPGPAAAWAEGSYSSASEKSLIALTNRSRAAAGLRALKVDSTLTSVARWRSKDMIQRDYFGHDIPGYGSVFKKLDSKGYCYRVAGENIGWNNYPDDTATAAIHGMFMDSSGHRKNILGKAWDVIGIGAYQGPDGKKMWTVLFADKCGGSNAPKPTPKPTAKPKPKPAATAKPKPAATAKPTPKPTPKPTAKPTPTPEPTPTPTPLVRDEPVDTGLAGPTAAPTAAPTSAATTGSAAATSLRISTPAQAGGLLETIVGGVTGIFFGA